MNYTKPTIVSRHVASTAVMGTPKQNFHVDNMSGGTPSYLSSAAAYEGDE